MNNNEGVLTTKDFINQQQIISGDIKPLDIKVNNRILYRYKFPPAPKGKSQTTLYYKNKPFIIEMIDGVYTLPENKFKKKSEKEIFHLFMLNLGFIDMCEIEDSNTKEDEDKNIKDEKPIFTLFHPDNTKDDKINGKVSVIVNEKEMEFDCVDGKVSTDDENILKAFIEKGWSQI